MARLLHPTLWRTCRVLSGKTRLQLFRSISDRPDQTVTEMAKQIGISLPRASQELRRLQSRGLVQAIRKGRYVRFRPVADREVASAPLLLQAMQETFRLFPEPEDEKAMRIAAALSNERRLTLVRLLLKGPWSLDMLKTFCGMAPDALHRHLLCLEEGGLAARDGKRISLVENPHPLAQGLVKLLQDAPMPPRA